MKESTTAAVFRGPIAEPQSGPVRSAKSYLPAGLSGFRNSLQNWLIKTIL